MTALQNVVRYTDDAAGLEKCLRLLQGFCNIAIGLTDPVSNNADLRKYTAARNQFALGRRYFRLFKWYPCWRRASSLLSPTINNDSNESIHDGRGVVWIFAIVKFTFLGLYFFLEALTITNAVGLTEFAWGPGVLRESNKCWVYALVASICVGLGQLLSSRIGGSEGDAAGNEEKKGTGKKGEKNGKENAVQARKMVNRKAIYTQIVIDTADLFIPGAAVGWIHVSMLVVGVASTISTVLAGRQIWERIAMSNQTPAEKIASKKL